MKLEIDLRFTTDDGELVRGYSTTTTDLKDMTEEKTQKVLDDVRWDIQHLIKDAMKVKR